MTKIMLNKNIRNKIISHLKGYEILKNNWRNIAIYIGGSYGAGLADKYSDIDVFALAPNKIYDKIYNDFKQKGYIEDNSYFFIELPFPPYSHFSVDTFENAEKNITNLNSPLMYGYANSLVLSDPTTRFSRIKKRAAGIPSKKLKELVKFTYLDWIYHTGATSNSLWRKDTASLSLCAWKGLEKALMICCLLDGVPYPQERKIFQIGLNTKLGKEIKPLFKKYIELLQTNVLRRSNTAKVPAALAKHKGLEFYKYYEFRRQLKLIFKKELEKIGLKGKWLKES